MFPTKKFFFASMAFLLFHVAAAAELNPDFEAGYFPSSCNEGMNYRLFVPESSSVNPALPFVIFLHGAGQRGDDNLSQLTHGAKAIREFTLNTDQPAIILAAQVPTGEQWVNTPWGDDRHAIPSDPSCSMANLMGLVSHLAVQLPVDRDRIYVTGLSMGGFGTWDILARMPDFFAAAIPICGGADLRTAALIKDVPIWIFHGELDTIVKTSRSREMQAALLAVGASSRYTEYPGVEHDSWTMTYSDSAVMQWLFDQHR